MAPSVFAGLCVIACLGAPPSVAAADAAVKVVTHRSRPEKLSVSEMRAIYLKQRLLWGDGRPIVPINRDAGSDTRERFSERVFGQGSHRLAGYWNQRYFEAGQFPPATLASDEAVIRFVAGNENAIGYVAAEVVTDGVVVVLMLK